MSTMSSSGEHRVQEGHPTGELGRDVRFDELFRRLLQTLAVTVEHELGEAPGELGYPPRSTRPWRRCRGAVCGCAGTSGWRARRACASRGASWSLWASTTLSRDSISSHRERVAKTSQAAVYALAISAGAAPVSSRDGRRTRGRPVYQVVHHAGCGDLASQPVLAHLLAEAFAQRRGEVALQLDRGGSSGRSESRSCL